MTFSVLPFTAAALSFLIACAALLKKRSLPSWCFFIGMVIFGVDSIINGLCPRSPDSVDALHWLTLGSTATSFLPAAWLGFSLTYSRGGYQKSLARWRIPVLLVALLPVVGSLVLQQDFYEGWP